MDFESIPPIPLPKRPSRCQEEVPDLAGRLPPHSIPAEQGVLGCILLDPQNALDGLSKAVNDQPEAFYDLRHRTILEAMLALMRAKVSIDLITLVNHLKGNDQLDSIGGIAYLASLSDAVPSAANLTYYLGILEEKWKARQLIKVATEISSKAMEQDGNGVDQLVDELGAWSSKIGASDVHKQKTVKEVLTNLIIDLEQEQKGIFKQVVETGMLDFDKRFRGLNYGEMSIIAARPSCGKTACMLQMALHMAKSQPVGIFSLEMTHESLYRRMLSNLAGLNLRDIQTFNDRDMVKLNAAGIRLNDLPIQVTDQSGLSVRQISAITRDWVRRHGTRVIMVDYLQLSRGTMKRSMDDRRLEIGEISAGLKNLAKELNLAVVVLSQLNREVERRGEGSKPRMSDLLECGNIEQDADVIIFLWNGKPEDDDKRRQDDQKMDQINITVAKFRNGATGDVHMNFDKTTQRFLPLARSTVESYQTHP